MDRRWKRQRMLPCHWPLDFHAWLWFWWFWKQFGVALPGLLAYSSRWWNQRYLCWRYGEPFVDVDRRVQAGAVLFPANASAESEPAIVKTEGNYRYALIWSWALCTATSKRVDINNLCLTWFRIKFEERHVAPAVCPMFNILMSWLYLTACICVWLTAHVCRALNYICLRFASMQSVTYRFSCNPRHIKGRDKLIEMLLVCCAFVCTSARQYQLQTKIRLSSKGSQFAGNHHLFALPFTRLNVRGRRSFSYTIKKAAIEWKKTSLPWYAIWKWSLNTIREFKSRKEDEKGYQSLWTLYILFVFENLTSVSIFRFPLGEGSYRTLSNVSIVCLNEKWINIRTFRIREFHRYFFPLFADITMINYFHLRGYPTLERFYFKWMNYASSRTIQTGDFLLLKKKKK